LMVIYDAIQVGKQPWHGCPFLGTDAKHT
jgi:hypothetical protein